MKCTTRQSAGKDKSLAYIAGVYIGDGCLTRSKKVKIFRLNTIDKDFSKHTKKALKTLGHTDVKIYTYKDKRFPKSNLQYQLYSNAKDLWSLKELTSSKDKLPEFIKQGSDECKREFIAGAMDSDGFIYGNKWTTRRNGKTWTGYRWMLGISATGTWIDEFVGLLQTIGVTPGKRLERLPYKGAKRMKIQYLLNKKTFITSGCYFKIKRKQDRLEAYQSGLSPQRLHAQRLNR